MFTSLYLKSISIENRVKILQKKYLNMLKNQQLNSEQNINPEENNKAKELVHLKQKELSNIKENYTSVIDSCNELQNLILGNLFNNFLNSHYPSLIQKNYRSEKLCA